MSETQHLAQLKIGRLRYPTSDSRVADFMNNLDVVNAIAERSKGFVWRLKDDSGNATNFRPFTDPNMLVNLSVWENVETLQRFVWQTAHKRIYERRLEWFDKIEAPHFVMWWIPKGHLPSLTEAKERLAHLATHGPSDYAFGWERMPAARSRTQARYAPDGQPA